MGTCALICFQLDFQSGSAVPDEHAAPGVEGPGDFTVERHCPPDAAVMFHAPHGAAARLERVALQPETSQERFPFFRRRVPVGLQHPPARRRWRCRNTPTVPLPVKCEIYLSNAPKGLFVIPPGGQYLRLEGQPPPGTHQRRQLQHFVVPARSSEDASRSRTPIPHRRVRAKGTPENTGWLHGVFPRER